MSVGNVSRYFPLSRAQFAVHLNDPTALTHSIAPHFFFDTFWTEMEQTHFTCMKSSFSSILIEIFSKNNKKYSSFLYLICVTILLSSLSFSAWNPSKVEPKNCSLILWSLNRMKGKNRKKKLSFLTSFSVWSSDFYHHWSLTDWRKSLWNTWFSCVS